MTELDDHGLLEEFARSESEEAFATLVARHVNLVYSAAQRFTGNPHHAQEITQAVFIILARKAKSISRKTILSGWLYQTTRLTAANFVRGEIRRQQREQEAYMQSTLNEPGPAAWEQIAPLLDEAMGCLGETDRNAVVLRFFENRTAQEVGEAMKLTEAAAHKRTARALEKLRTFFSKRGVTLTATVIAGTVAANSVQAAPVDLAATISTVAIAKGATVGASTLALVKGALKLMTWTKAKMAVVVGVGVLIAAGTAIVVYKHVTRPIYIAEMTSFSQQYAMKVGPAMLGWSQRENSPEVRDGYIMMRNSMPDGHNEPLWEFALSPKQSLQEVTRADLHCTFYGMNDPKGHGKFGDDWFDSSIRVSEGQVIFARLITNRSVVYAIRLAKQGGNRDKATIQIEYVIESGFTNDGH